jgi:hypothetical protein
MATSRLAHIVVVISSQPPSFGVRIEENLILHFLSFLQLAGPNGIGDKGVQLPDFRYILPQMSVVEASDALQHVDIVLSFFYHVTLPRIYDHFTRFIMVQAASMETCRL